MVPLSGSGSAATPAVDEEITSEAVAPPAAAGVKTTPTVQLFWPLTLLRIAPQVEASYEKLLAEIPVIWNPTFSSGAPPVLLIVTVCAALGWPTVCPVNVRLAGLEPSTGGARPVPLRATVCGCVRVMSAMVNVPGCGPVDVGANCTLMVQLEFAARLAPQRFVC